MSTFVLVHGSNGGGWEAHEVAAGHLAMLTAPRELARLLLDLALKATPRETIRAHK